MSYACIFVTITFMEKRIDYEIKENDCGKTIESYLRERGYSRKILVHLRQTNLGITVAGELAYTTRVLKEGNILSVRLSEETSSERIIPVKCSGRSIPRSRPHWPYKNAHHFLCKQTPHPNRCAPPPDPVRIKSR